MPFYNDFAVAWPTLKVANFDQVLSSVETPVDAQLGFPVHALLDELEHHRRKDRCQGHATSHRSFHAAGQRGRGVCLQSGCPVAMVQSVSAMTAQLKLFLSCFLDAEVRYAARNMSSARTTFERVRSDR